MADTSNIKKVEPRLALPGGEIVVEYQGLFLESGMQPAFSIDGHAARAIGASSRRAVLEVPSVFQGGRDAGVKLDFGGSIAEIHALTIAELIKDGFHFVANPAVDPKDGTIVMTRSGGRGQMIGNTLFRLEADGYVDELPVNVMNPTGVAFGPDRELYVTNRRDGEVYRIERNEDAVTIASGLGIATGLAFDKNGVLFVGDRAGTIYRILDDGSPDVFAKLEPSVAAYHLAFGPDGRLYVSAPGLASHEPVYAIDKSGTVETYFRGFGRPQGIAFGADGTMYIAACYRGKRGIFAVEYESGAATHIVAGNMIVGLCFNAEGDMIIATGETLFSLPLSIKGTLF